jgi:hypothetical protein
MRLRETIMRTLTLAALCASLAIPPAAGAESAVDPFLRPVPSGPPESGLSVGARVGWGAPLGKASQGSDLSSVFSGSVPLQVDAGWRFSPSVYAGLYFQYGVAQLDARAKSGCDASGVSCSSSTLRLGADLVYTFLPRARLAPWVGVGAGFETSRLKAVQGGQSVEVAYKGLELGHLAAGFDLRPWTALRVGPFANFTLAQFTSVDTPVDPATNQIGATRTIDIQQKAIHGWLQLGIRAVIDL